MSKAVYVMDMPKNGCIDCVFCFEIDEGIEACCTITGELNDEDSFRKIEEDYCQCKPDWCPLKPMPEKKEKVVKGHSMGIVSCAFADGWNDCINAICGEEG